MQFSGLDRKAAKWTAAMSLVLLPRTLKEKVSQRSIGSACSRIQTCFFLCFYIANTTTVAPLDENLLLGNELFKEEKIGHIKWRQMLKLCG